MATSDRVRSTDAAYDAVAEDFAARTAGLSEGAARFLDCFLAEVEPASIVIDAGCGPGHQAAIMAEHGHHVLALDRSVEMVRRVPPPIHRARGDLLQVPVADGVANALWSCAALLHVDARHLGDAFAEWDRVVRPGGLIAFATSTGGGADWETPPADSGRVPELPAGQRRWFVHHDVGVLRRAVADQGWNIVHDSVRTSHRDWLQVIARR